MQKNTTRNNSKYKNDFTFIVSVHTIARWRHSLTDVDEVVTIKLV